MLNRTVYLCLVSFLVTTNPSFSQKLVADHTILSQTTPESWSIPQWLVDSANQNLGIYFAHKSHGRQIVQGLNAIREISSRYGIDISSATDALQSGVLSIRDGNTYIGDFFDGDTPANQVLSENTWVNTCLFVWCSEFNYGAWPDVGVMWDSARVVNEYLAKMEALEEAFPEVQFIYCTGSAYHNAGAEKSYNRFKLNNMIRRYCAENDKVLYDFADLDAWAYNRDTGRWERDTAVYEIDGEMVSVPHQHARYEHGPGTHATPESELVKAMAFWWMMTELATGEVAAHKKKSGREFTQSIRNSSNFLGHNHSVWNLRGQSIRPTDSPNLLCSKRLGNTPGLYIVSPPASEKRYSPQKLMWLER